MGLTYATDVAALVRENLSPTVTDNIFKKSPVLDALKKTMKPYTGLPIQELITYDTRAGTWIDIDEQLVHAPSPSVTRASYTRYNMYTPCMVNTIELQEASGPEALANLMTTEVTNATESFREELSKKLFITQASKAFNSLYDAANDTTGYGGIATADFAGWKAFVMEASSGGTTTSVAPSIANIKSMINRMVVRTGKRPDMVVVHPDYYDALVPQVDAIDQLVGTRVRDIIDMGFTALSVMGGIPIVQDESMCGTTWSSGARANGYEALILNFDAVRIRHLAQSSFKLSEVFVPNDYWTQFARIEFHGNITCNNRRCLGHIFNVDLALDPTDWYPGVVVAPG